LVHLGLICRKVAENFSIFVPLESEKGNRMMKRYFIVALCSALAIFAFLTETANADFGLMLGSFKNKENAQNYLNR